VRKDFQCATIKLQRNDKSGLDVRGSQQRAQPWSVRQSLPRRLVPMLVRRLRNSRRAKKGFRYA